MGLRRRRTEHAVLAWRAGRDAVREALAHEGVPAAVGPHERGWTLVRVLADRGEVVEPRGRHVLDLLDDLARTLGVPGATCVPGDLGARAVWAVEAGRPPVSARVPAVDSADAPERGEWSALLRALDRLGSLEAVLSAAAVAEPATRRTRGAAATTDRRGAAVAEAAGLPEGLLDQGTVAAGAVLSEVVLAREVAAPFSVDVVASAVGQPLRSVEVDGWTVVTAAEEGPRPGLLPVAAGLGAGRQPALLLWRQGEARGYQLLRRSEIEDVHVWDRGWEVVLPDDVDPQARADLHEALAPAEGDAALLHARFAPQAGPDALPATRSLLRRPPGPEVLADLAAVLGLPAGVAAVVEGAAGPEQLGEVVTHEPGSRTRAVLDSASAPRPGDPWLLRQARRRPWWWRLWSLAWVVVALGWAGSLWSGGGVVARGGAILLVLSAVLSLYDGLAPRGRERPGATA